MSNNVSNVESKKTAIVWMSGLCLDPHFKSLVWFYFSVSRKREVVEYQISVYVTVLVEQTQGMTDVFNMFWSFDQLWFKCLLSYTSKLLPRPQHYQHKAF